MDILILYFQIICMLTSNAISVDFPPNEVFLQALTNFALNLYREVGSINNENLFISPIGDQMLLTLILQGTKGETEAELKNALLYQTLPYDEINLQFKELNNRLNVVHDSYILQLANRFYFQKGFQYQNEFSKLLATYYSDSVQEVEFLTNLKIAEEEINHWVKRKTNGKITDIVKDLAVNTKLILTSVLYFKGNWDTPFNESNTKIGNFTSSQGLKQSIEMMTQSKSFMYGEDHILNCKIVELPYFSKDLSMFILLPFDINGLKQLELKLNYMILKSMIKNMTEVELNPLQIPKFKMNKEYHLMSALQNLGIKKVFEHPDLSGMLRNTSSLAVYLSEVIQKTFLEVNEKGSEAAASTEVQIGFRMMSLLNGAKKDFIANQPFMFFIRENISGIILFLGRVTSDDK